MRRGVLARDRLPTAHAALVHARAGQAVSAFTCGRQGPDQRGGGCLKPPLQRTQPLHPGGPQLCESRVEQDLFVFVYLTPSSMVSSWARGGRTGGQGWVCSVVHGVQTTIVLTSSKTPAAGAANYK